MTPRERKYKEGVDAVRAQLIDESARIVLGHDDRGHILQRLGLLAGLHDCGDVAVNCLSVAAGLKPHCVEYMVALADELCRQGQTSLALAAYLRAITGSWTDPDIYFKVGRALALLGHLVEASALYRESLRLRPNDPLARRELGHVFRRRGHLTEAIREYEVVLQGNNDDVEARLALAEMASLSSDWERAAEDFRLGLLIQKERADLHVGLGRALTCLGRFEEAILAFRGAVEIEPMNVVACRELVCLNELLGRRDESVSAWMELGWCLESRRKFNDALAAYRAVLSRQPKCLFALARLGALCMEMARPHEAIKYFEEGLTIAPETDRLRQELASAYHLVGDHRRGWGERLKAWRLRDTNAHLCDRPLWDGAPLGGRTILVWADQYLGDTIQLLRYLQIMKDHGARIVFECHRDLLPIARNLSCVDTVMARGMVPSAYDVHAPLSVVPSIVLQGDRIPCEVPYITVESGLVSRWRQRLGQGSGRLVGVVWSGDPSHHNAESRFIPLQALAVWANTPDVRFISLQPASRSVRSWRSRGRLSIEQYLDESASIADTAALILNLDLVVTVDTMVAHLTGALARPVWTLLPFAASWPWLHSGERTPWYPTMRLFRQSHPGDWSGLLARVRASLES